MRIAMPARIAVWVMLVSVVSLTATAASDLQLVEAAKRGDATAMVTLLQQGVDANEVALDGATALHWVAHRDDVETAGLLLRAGARATATNDYGVTPLTLAAENGSAAMVELLLGAGADANAALPSGETVLMTAARTGKTAAVTALLTHGADPNTAEASKGQTALMWALAEQHLEVARTLLAHGADVHLGSDGKFTPLMWAVRQGQQPAVQLLLDAGADLSGVATDGSTPLLVATVRGHVDLAKYLLAKGADPNADAAGYTPLHYVAGRWDGVDAHDYLNAPGEWQTLRGVPEARKLELINALLDHDANPNARLTKEPPRYGYSLVGASSPRRTQGGTPFFIAAMSADVDVMRFLAANGADPLLTSKSGITPMMMAAGMGWAENEVRLTGEDYLPAVALCLELGGDVHAATDRGDTALHGTVRGGFNEVVQFLVDNGADVNAKNRAERTPLHVLESSGFGNGGGNTRSTTVALLRSLGAVSEGSTPDTPFSRRR